METPAQMRAHAERCEHLAKTATTEKQRQLLLDTALQWRKLADEEDRSLYKSSDA